MRKDSFNEYGGLDRLPTGTKINGVPIGKKPEDATSDSSDSPKEPRKMPTGFVLLLAIVVVINLASAACYYILAHRVNEERDYYKSLYQQEKSSYEALEHDYDFLRDERNYLNDALEASYQTRARLEDERDTLELEKEFITEAIGAEAKITVGGEEVTFSDLLAKAAEYAAEHLDESQMPNAPEGGGRNDDMGPGPYEPTPSPDVPDTPDPFPEPEPLPDDSQPAPAVPKSTSDKVEESQYQPKADYGHVYPEDYPEADPQVTTTTTVTDHTPEPVSAQFQNEDPPTTRPLEVPLNPDAGIAEQNNGDIFYLPD